jgi:FkbM family methyltransferase
MRVIQSQPKDVGVPLRARRSILVVQQRSGSLSGSANMVAAIGTIERDLIFDVGASNGDDSGYYLHKGYRVLAVEPNPASISVLRRRFASAIDTGRYKLVTEAISASKGETQFWVCDDAPLWSSFDRKIASYSGAAHHSVLVQTCRFSSLIAEYGTPFYCKIDIEGSDRLCLEQLTPATRPPFLSVELPTIGSFSKAAETAMLMSRLDDLGYTRFKLISQVTYRQPSSSWLMLKAALPMKLSARLTSLDGATRRLTSEAGWVFEDESSGPFGPDTLGSWLDTGDARRLIGAIQRNRDLSDWYDVHAAVADFV